MGRKTKVALTVGAAGVAAWAASKVVAKPVPREGKKALDFDKPVILAHRGGLSKPLKIHWLHFQNQPHWCTWICG